MDFFLKFQVVLDGIYLFVLLAQEESKTDLRTSQPCMHLNLLQGHGLSNRNVYLHGASCSVKRKADFIKSWNIPYFIRHHSINDHR